MAKKKAKKIDIKKLIPIIAAALAVVIIVVSVLWQVNTTGEQTAKNAGVLVYIDPGHGGNDAGASSLDGSRLEKDDTLKLALRVSDILHEKGVRTQLSRSVDERVELDARWQEANEINAALFVSIHRNSATTGNGVEIWVQSTKPKEDTLLANNIMKQLEKAEISKNRGVRFGYMGNPKSDYAVNKGSEMPSCLIELGFITNDEDNELFDKNFEKYANAIANGIVKTVNDLNLKPESEEV